MENLRYSIIFGTTRPEISEQISLGIIYFNGKDTRVKLSNKKIDLFKRMISAAQQEVVGQSLRGLARKGAITSEEMIGYLHRYSNNLITISGICNVNLPASSANEDWLYRRYVYDSRRS